MLCRCSSYLHPNFEWRGGGGGGVWIVLLSAVTLFEYNVSTIFIAYCFINCSSLRPIYWYIKIPTLLRAFKKKGKTIRCPNFRGCHQLSHTYCLPAGSLRMRLAMLQYMMSPYEAGWAACVFFRVHGRPRGRQAYFAVQKIWTLDWQRVGARKERLILSFLVVIMMAAAINVPLGRAQKNQTNKQRNAGMERGSQVDKREKIRQHNITSLKTR